jgi:hypothetical protein
MFAPQKLFFLLFFSRWKEAREKKSAAGKQSFLFIRVTTMARDACFFGGAFNGIG